MANLTDVSETLPAKPEPTVPQKARPRRWPWFLAGFFFILLLIVLGSYLGYQSGISLRMAGENSQVTLQATDQFQRGLLDMQAGNFDQARQRFEYVLQIDPNFPGVKQKLTEVIVAMNRTATPTVGPTATTIPLTPTPDLRGVDQIFQDAQTLLLNKDWQKAIVTLDTLRKANLQYRTVDVDGMYYIALRNLGVQNILNDGELEMGIYNLALAERFGPLDRDADSYRTWAQYYITGASFWQVDWSQVVYYFAMVYPVLPNLHDGGANGMTATERYRLGSIAYGNKLAAAGDYCGAKVQYQHALSLHDDPTLDPTATFVTQKCGGGATATPHAKTITPPPLTPTPIPPTDTPLPPENTPVPPTESPTP